MKFFLTLTCFILCSFASAQDVVHNDGVPTDSIDRMAPDFVTASICVADPTDWHDDMLGVLGHAFIRLQCPTFNLDYCYSYEGQSVNDDPMGLVQGKLKMGLFAAPTQEYLEPYKKWNRTVREYTLNLPPEAELRLWEIMDKHLEDGIDLPLDLTEHGCTQTLVEYITLSLDTTAIEYAAWPEEFEISRYEVAYKELDNYPWLRLVTKALGMFGEFDEECDNEEKIILPRQLVEVWQQAKVEGKPLLTYNKDLTKGESPVVERPWFTPGVAGSILAVIVLLLAAIIFRKKKRA